jgi:hypothetical protein
LLFWFLLTSIAAREFKKNDQWKRTKARGIFLMTKHRRAKTKEGEEEFFNIIYSVGS